jgi:peptide/nickel transport system substrate-binding protein
MSIRRGVVALLLVLPLAAGAGTLRWAARGDAGSLDPHAFNEGMTNSINGHIYELLGSRERDGTIGPRLATRWTVVEPTVWRFELRRGVSFSDGTPFTAADVVFSIERAQQPTSQQAFFARKLGQPVAVDAHTVELRLPAPNPLLLEHQLNVLIMSRAWAQANGSLKVPEFKTGQEAPSSRSAMGTGPYLLKSREAGVRTVLVRNPNWWGTFVGNVDEVVFTPIGNEATRTAALLSGGIDFTHEIPTHDLGRLADAPDVKLWSGVENRVLFFGMDQARDELLYASVKGRNPFKDRRVREALYRAIDAEAIRTKIMRGQSRPTACMAPAAAGCAAAELEHRPVADLPLARRLLAEAGYPDGFSVTLDCPNDRYVNDQAICVAVAAMLGRIGVRVKVDSRPKSLYFQKVDRRDTSFFLLGWGGGTIDAQSVLDPLIHSFDAKTQKGGDNHGGIADSEIDELIDAAGVEMESTRRNALLAAALRRLHDQVYVVPLHRQMLTWAARRGVTPVVMPDNGVRLHWVRIE